MWEQLDMNMFLQNKSLTDIGANHLTQTKNEHMGNSGVWTGREHTTV